MRRNPLSVIVPALVALSVFACTSQTVQQATQVALDAKEALTQAQGCATALGTLLQASTLDAETKAKALAAAQTIATMTGASATAIDQATAGKIQSAADTLAETVPTISQALGASQSGQVSGWASWLQVALRAAGIVATVVAGS